MNAIIITIGDELLIGQVVNTNQAWLVEKFNLLGIFVEQMQTIGDDETEILKSFQNACNNFDFVCITGGLGPTHDDITKQTISKYFNKNLQTDSKVLENIEELLSHRKIPLSNVAKSQALIPTDFLALKNRLGTAPGLFYKFNLENKSKFFLALPGVPHEMKVIIEESFIPFIKNEITDEVILHKTIRTTGIIEAQLSEKIGDVSKFLGNDGICKLAFLPSPRGTKLRITVRASNFTIANKRLQKASDYIFLRAQNFIYADTDIEIEEVLSKILAEKNITLSIAESCTGGFISNRITNIPGSSQYFLQSFITYSNQSKIKLLNVSENLISQFGSVSQEVCEQMAIGAKNISGSSVAISVTGIAGPTGGTPQKPVGSAWISFYDGKNLVSKFNNYGQERLLFKERVSQAALELLRRMLLKLPI